MQAPTAVPRPDRGRSRGPARHGRPEHGPWQSIVFVVLGLAQLGVALAVRARPAPGTARNWSLIGAVAVSGLLQIAGVLVPALQTLLGTESLTATELLACAAVAALPGLALHLTSLIGRRAAVPAER